MKYFLIVILLFSNLFIAISVTAKPLHFALFSPRAKQDPFWGPLEDFTLQASKQLNVKITVFNSNNSKREMLKFISQAKALNVDAVIFANIGKIALPLMKSAEQLKLPVLLFNSDFIGENKKIAGQPQQKFKYWIASLMPDDEHAGYLLGKYLIEQARERKLSLENGKVQIIAINGSIADTPSHHRFLGLQRAIKEDGNSELVQSLHAFWLQETAAYKALHLSKRYPNVKVYWTASDLMAIGVEQALTGRGLVQGKDYLTGGVDWSIGGLNAVKQGKISTSVGGHFMDGAWALIMLYDHFNGERLDGQELYLYHSPMSLISSTEIDILLPYLNSHKWDKINFQLRSKVFNKDLKQYDFSPTSILQELKKHNKD